MKEKYIILKRLYPEFLVIVKKKDKLYSFELDNDMMRLFKYKSISHIIVDNFDLEIVDKSNYEKYYLKTKLISLLETKRKELKENG